METSQIKFVNCGPILKGTFAQKRINVFFGPNNSGKSFASRLIHGINYMPGSKRELPTFVLNYFKQKKLKVSLNVVYTNMVLYNSGFNINDIINEKKKSSISLMNKKKKTTTLNFNSIGDGNFLSFVNKLIPLLPDQNKSVFVPTGRTGLLQFFTNIVQARNRLLNEMMVGFGMNEQINTVKSKNKTASNIKLQDVLPNHLEQFNKFIFDMYSQHDLNFDIQQTFSELFDGMVEMKSGNVFPQIVYKDNNGLETNIEFSGSSIISMFIILLGLSNVEYGGTLIVEEPELNLDPLKQLNLIDVLVKSAKERDISLIFNTHSDGIISKLLSLVSSKQIKRTDLGMYYFDRDATGFTTIREIRVDKDGTAEQPLSMLATDKLIEEFSK